MRKYKPHTDKAGCRFGRGFFLAVICLCLLASCSTDETMFPDVDDETTLPDDGGHGTCRVTLRLDVASFSRQGAGVSTRSVAGTSDENLVKDLWVFQFSVNGDTLLKQPVYISESALGGNVNEITIDFVQNAPGDSSYVCVVANTLDENWTLNTDVGSDNYHQTLDEFKTYASFTRQAALPTKACEPFLSANMGETGGKTIPMYGESAKIVIASKTYIRVPLYRMFAKVHVTVDASYPAAHNLHIQSVTYSNIPSYCRVKEITNKESYPVGIDWIEKEYVKEDVGEYTLYMPENRQGVVSGITGKSDSDSSLFPEHALAVKVKLRQPFMSDLGDDYSDSPIFEYTVYPGLDMVNDFNIKRNYVYTVNIKILSDPGSDAVQP